MPELLSPPASGPQPPRRDWTETRRRWRAIGLGVAVALALAMLALALPAHWRSVAPTVVQAAGQGTTGLVELTRGALASGRLGAARQFLDAAKGERWANATELEFDDRLAGNVRRRLSGGPDSYFETFLDRTTLTQASWRPLTPVAELLLSSPRVRLELRQYLAASENPAVHAPLAQWETPGWRRLTPGGSLRQPLETSLLLVGLLALGDHLPPAHSYALDRWLRDTTRLVPGAQAELDAYLFDVLSLARRLDFATLAALCRQLPEAGHLQALAAQVRRGDTPGEAPAVAAAAGANSRLAVLFSALQLGAPAPRLLAFIDEHTADEAWPALALAVRGGQGSVALLLARQQPLLEPPLWFPWADGGWLARWAVAEATPWLALKLVLALGAGLALALAGRIFIAWLTGDPGCALCQPRAWAGPAVSAVILAFILQWAAEPHLLHFNAPPPPTMSLDFASLGLDLATATAAPLHEAVGPTIALTAFFLAIQAFVYVISYRRLRAIQADTAPAAAKLALLDNEEVLFDFGLYVGLIGTAIAFILLSLGLLPGVKIVAYVSTLFGIIFVAVLKIFQVRPYRRQLLLEMQQPASATTPPASNP